MGIDELRWLGKVVSNQQTSISATIEKDRQTDGQVVVIKERHDHNISCRPLSNPRMSKKVQSQ